MCILQLYLLLKKDNKYKQGDRKMSQLKSMIRN